MEETAEASQPAPHLPQGHPLADGLSNRERRERENQECIGGLRNPRFSIEKVPSLLRAGDLLRETLFDWIDQQDSDFTDKLLDEGSEEMAELVQKAVSQHLATRLGCSPRRGRHGKLRPELAASIQTIGQDPDTAVVQWMDEGAPLGVSAPITPCGIFPLVPPGTKSVEESAKYYARAFEDQIYRSAVEEKKWVLEKLESIAWSRTPRWRGSRTSRRPRRCTGS